MHDSHHYEPAFVLGEARYRDARKVTIVRAIIKIFAGWFGSSRRILWMGHSCDFYRW